MHKTAEEDLGKVLLQQLQPELGVLVVAPRPFPGALLVDVPEQDLRGDLGGEDGDAEAVLHHTCGQVMARVAGSPTSNSAR